MKKVSLLIGVVGFKYIARNKVGNGGYEIFCWDLNTKEVFKNCLVPLEEPCSKED
jgi:hypothetical protein